MNTLREKIRKEFQEEVGKIDTHYLNACQDIRCERTLIGNIFEKYLGQFFSQSQAEQVKAIEELARVVLGNGKNAESLNKTTGSHWALSQVLSILKEKRQ